MAWGKGWLLASAVSGALVTPAGAEGLSVTRVAPVRPGWTRVALRYDAKGVPGFRVTPTCASPLGARWTIAATVRVVPGRRQARLDLRDDLAWLADRRLRCEPTGLEVQMLRGRTVIARARLPVTLPAAPAPPEPAPVQDPLARRLHLAADKRFGPQAQTSEAGVTWSLGEHTALELSYQSTVVGRTVPRDVDNGVRTGVRVGF